MWMLLLCLFAAQVHCEKIVQFHTETIISQNKQLNAGYSKLDIIIRVPRLNNVTPQTYRLPCSYLEEFRDDFRRVDIIGKLKTSWYADYENRFQHICNDSSTLRDLNIAIRNSYIQNIQNMSETIDYFRYAHNTRQSRSVASSIRHFFGVADYTQQKKLRQQVRQLDDQVFTQEGVIIGLQFAVEHHSAKIKHLQQHTVKLTEALNNLHEHIFKYNRIVVAGAIMDKFRYIILSESMQCGIIYNQYLGIYNNIISERMHALSMLTRNYLPPSLISPNILDEILENLRNKLNTIHPSLELSRHSVYDFYKHKNIVSFVEDQDFFIKIPIILNMHRQLFKIFNLESFYIPVPHRNDQAMILQHKNVIAVNKAANTYITLESRDLETCHGNKILLCDTLFTQKFINKVNTCELAIVSNNTDLIKQKCDVGLVQTSIIETKFYDLSDNSVLIVNPHREQVYEMCNDRRHQKFVSANFLTVVQLPCWRWLHTQTVVSPAFAHAKCANTTQFDTFDPTNNLLYIALLLNESVGNIADYNLTNIPKLELPKIVEDFTLDDDIDALNLKKILHERQKMYRNMVQHKLDKQNESLRTFTSFKTLASVGPVVAFIVVIVIIVFTIKTKRLSQLLVVMGLVKKTNALENTCTPYYLQIMTECFLIILLISALIFYCIKYLRFFEKIKRQTTLPFRECLSVSPPNKQRIMLYLSNLTEYCYLYLDNITDCPPDKIKVIPSEEQFIFTLHNSCCAHYITCNPNTVKIEIGANQSYVLPQAIAVPLHLRYILRLILTSDYNVQLLCGSNSIFRAHDLRNEQYQQLVIASAPTLSTE